MTLYFKPVILYDVIRYDEILYDVTRYDVLLFGVIR
jgi:hypothetical protein